MIIITFETGDNWTRTWNFDNRVSKFRITRCLKPNSDIWCSTTCCPSLMVVWLSTLRSLWTAIKLAQSEIKSKSNLNNGLWNTEVLQPDVRIRWWWFAALGSKEIMKGDQIRAWSDRGACERRNEISTNHNWHLQVLFDKLVFVFSEIWVF